MNPFEQLDAEDRAVRQLVADTDKEILFEALGQDDDATENRAIAQDLERSEGWDGEPLSDAELAHRALHGDDPDNYDRPVEREELRALKDENAQLLKYNRDWQAWAANDPQAQAKLEEQRTAARNQIADNLMNQYGLVAVGDNAQTDRFINDVYGTLQQNNELQHARINKSMAAAHEKYGRDFESVYSDVVTMDQNSRLGNEIRTAIMNAEDPGEKLMEFHESGVVQGLRGRQPPPFMSRSPVPLQRSARVSARSGEIGGDVGWGDADTERDVFASAWD